MTGVTLNLNSSGYAYLEQRRLEGGGGRGGGLPGFTKGAGGEELLRDCQC